MSDKKDRKISNEEIAIAVLQGVGIVILVVIVALLMHLFFMGQYTGMKKGIFPPGGPPGTDYNNSWSSGTVIIENLFWLFIGMNALLGIISAISQNPIGNIVIALVCVIIVITDLVIVIFMITWNLVPAHDVDRGSALNPATSKYACCVEEFYNSTEFGCELLRVGEVWPFGPCTGPDGMIYSLPVHPKLKINTDFIFRFVYIILFGFLGTAGVIMALFGLWFSRQKAKDLFSDFDTLVNSLGITTSQIAEDMVPLMKNKRRKKRRRRRKRDAKWTKEV